MNDPALLQAALDGLEAQKARIEQQIANVRQLLGQRRSGTSAKNGRQADAAPDRKARELSPAARKRIAAAQKKRWADYRKNQAGSAKSE
jgi:hypothetical protein